MASKYDLGDGRRWKKISETEHCLRPSHSPPGIAVVMLQAGKYKVLFHVHMEREDNPAVRAEYPGIHRRLTAQGIGEGIAKDPEWLAKLASSTAEKRPAAGATEDAS